MLDIRQIRENPELVQAKLDLRGAGAYDIQPILVLDSKQRELEFTRSQLQARSNEIGKLVGEKMKSGTAPDAPEINTLKTEGNDVKIQLSELEPAERELKTQITTLILQLPNLPSDTTPIGKSEDENVELRKWGDEYIPTNPQILPHWEIGEKIGILNFESSAKIAQSRFVTLLGLSASTSSACTIGCADGTMPARRRGRQTPAPLRGWKASRARARQEVHSGDGSSCFPASLFDVNRDLLRRLCPRLTRLRGGRCERDLLRRAAAPEPTYCAHPVVPRVLPSQALHARMSRSSPSRRNQPAGTGSCSRRWKSANRRSRTKRAMAADGGGIAGSIPMTASADNSGLSSKRLSASNASSNVPRSAYIIASEKSHIRGCCVRSRSGGSSLFASAIRPSLA